MISSDIGKEVIKKELPLVPKLPGVYRMLNSKGEILYVGKAKNLPNRLKSYVSEKNHIIRTERMLSQTKRLEITTTSNESEALLLEANLIKKFKPKFNILLRDDKSFPFIFISNKEKWSQIKRHRGKKSKEGFNKFSLTDAILYAFKDKNIAPILTLAICMIVGALLQPLIPSYSRDNLGLDGSSYTLLQSVNFLGAILGSITLLKFGNRIISGKFMSLWMILSVSYTHLTLPTKRIV